MQRLHAADAPGVLERFHEHLYLVEVSAKQIAGRTREPSRGYPCG